MTIIAPVINNNGTSATALLDEHRQALTAIQQAIEAVKAITVHGRDYQAAPIGTYEAARNAHITRLEALESIAADTQAITIAIMRQRDADRDAVDYSGIM